jgi:superoxide dismutase, Cu-Zn family
MRVVLGVIVTLLVAVLGGETFAAQKAPVKVSMINGEQQQVGEMTLTETPNGILIRLDLQAKPSGIAPGEHALHIHDVGQCTPPFTSAGAHFNPAGKKHGFLEAQAGHTGDLPNIHVPANAPLTVEFLITQEPRSGEKSRLLDADGFALVIHQSADDYKTDPAGNSGDRIACGAVRSSSQSKK